MRSESAVIDIYTHTHMILNTLLTGMSEQSSQRLEFALQRQLANLKMQNRALLTMKIKVMSRHVNASLPALVFVARHGERLDYEWRDRDTNWQAQAKKPWDTPLTKAGHLQGAALGVAVRRHAQTLGSRI